MQTEEDQDNTQTILPPDWQKRDGWESREIRSRAKGNIASLWFFSCLLLLVALPLAGEIENEISRGKWGILIGLIFPLIGLWLVYKAILATLEYQRFGVVSFEMEPYPGAIGGHVAGRVHVSRLSHSQASNGATFNVRLECVHSYVSGRGENRSRSERVQWAEEGYPQIEMATKGVYLSFLFEVPEDAKAADIEQKGDSYYFWRLSVTGDIKGIDLQREYNIPVFHTRECSTAIKHNISDQVKKRQQEASEQAETEISLGRLDIPGLSRAMRYKDMGNALSLVFPMFRNKFLSLFAAIFAGGFGFASYSLIRMTADSGWWGLFSGIIAIPFVLVALFAGIATLYLPFNRLSVHISNLEIKTTRSLFFIPLVMRSVTTQDIVSIYTKSTGSTGDGVDKVKHFKLCLQDKRGRTIVIAEDIDGEDIAEHFKTYLMQRFSISVPL